MCRSFRSTLVPIKTLRADAAPIDFPSPLSVFVFHVLLCAYTTLANLTYPNNIYRCVRYCKDSRLTKNPHFIAHQTKRAEPCPDASRPSHADWRVDLRISTNFLRLLSTSGVRDKAVRQHLPWSSSRRTYHGDALFHSILSCLGASAPMSLIVPAH